MIDLGFETPIVAEDPVAERLTLKDAPVLSVGRFDSVLAKTEVSAARMKVDAEAWMRIAPDGSLLHGQSVKVNHVEDVFAAGRRFEN